ncbi:hypothetical protein BDZ89DRAFT_331671 [Hymenopellis radicata]|nr:hypothetical protein BDZ89DRAFT_331671 [Hymenopellis radicata]
MADATNAKYCTNCAVSLLQPTEVPKTRTDHVEELLRQNHPPLDVELSAFREVVETTPAALEALDLKIAQARELLENLLSARQHAQSHFEDAKSLLHPMRSIPNELLAKIFSHCIMKSYKSKDLDALDPRAAPWQLSGVCRRWRNLAINLPQLWTHLLLDFDKQRGHITGRQCAYKVGLFGERSRGFPMSVYLGSTMDDVTNYPVLPSLEVSIPRWESLCVDLPRISLQCLSGNSFSNLRKLAFYPNEESQWDLDLDIFQPARVPALREFGADTWFPFGEPLISVPLPWAQLTRVFDILVDTDGWIILLK